MIVLRNCCCIADDLRRPRGRKQAGPVKLCWHAYLAAAGRIRSTGGTLSRKGRGKRVCQTADYADYGITDRITGLRGLRITVTDYGQITDYGDSAFNLSDTLWRE